MRETALQTVRGAPGARAEISLQGKSVRSPPCQEEAAAEMGAEQTATPISHPPVPLWEWGIKNL